MLLSENSIEGIYGEREAMKKRNEEGGGGKGKAGETLLFFWSGLVWSFIIIIIIIMHGGVTPWRKSKSSRGANSTLAFLLTFRQTV